MKRKGILGGIIVVVLALVLALAVGGGSVSAEEPTIIASGDCGKDGSNVTWTLDSTGMLTISGEGEISDYGIVNSKTNAPWVKYRDKLFDLNIETGVTVIGASAFAGCNKLSGVSLSDSITSIGNCAFFECSGLTDIEISKNVTSIGSRAFENCTGLTSVTIPNGVTSIGGHTFDGCSNLLGIVIPDCVTSIGAYAFNNCSRLTNVTIPESVTNIGSYAFCGCSSLSSVLIPESVTNIGYLAFKDTPWIASLGEYAIINNILVAYQGNAADAIIPKEVTAIGDYAFQNCAELTNVIMSDGITAIGNSAFYNCSGLTSITMSNSVVSIGNYAFYGCSGLTSIIIPESVTSIGQKSFCGCSGLTDVQYNAKSAIDQRESDYVFGKAGILGNGVQLTIGDSVERIPAYLFYASSDYRNNIIGVTIGKNVTSIGEKAFLNCGKLNRLVIGESVSSIGVNAFAGCSKLVELQYNARAVIGLNISSGVFSYSGSGMKVTFGDGVEEIPSYLFHDDDYAYGSSPEISSVTMGDGVTSIGRQAFSGCTGLTSVTIGNSVTSIGYCAFTGCRGLTSVTIPDSVTSIGQYAFSSCTGLTEILYNAKAAADLDYYSNVFSNAGTSSDGLRVVIGDSVERIPAYLFYGCTGLTEILYNAKAAADLNSGSKVFYNAGTSSGDLRVVIGDGVDKIPAYLFHGCTGLTSVTIPDSVTSIGYWAFKDCNNIEKVHISDIAAWCGIVFGSYESNPLAYAKDLYVNDALVTDLTIPNGVTSIGNYAFYGCTGLSSVTIPNGVTSIGIYAFSGCTRLSSVTIGNGVTSIGRQAFYGCNSIEKVHISDITAWCEIVFEDYYSNPLNANCLYVNDTLVTNLTIPNDVTSIGTYAFHGCTSLASVTIPDSVTSIGSSVFSGCTGLTSVTIPNSVASIGSSAFKGCTGLTSVTIPDSVTSIGDSAFSGCAGLTSVTIGNSVTSIGGSAFSGCTRLRDITIPNGVTSIGRYAFDGCTGLTSVTIGNGVTSIGNRAFSGCSGMTEIIYNAKAAANLTSDSNVFYNAGASSGSLRVVIGNGVERIPDNLFYGCTSLTEIIYNAKAAADLWYKAAVFRGAGTASNGLRVIIGEGVEHIPDYLFRSCADLTEVCYNAKSVEGPCGTVFQYAGTSSFGFRAMIGDGVECIPHYLFSGCTGLTSVTIGNGETRIGEGAFRDCTRLTSVTIGNSVTSIGGSAFSGCTRLRDITIPNGVTSIGQYAFDGCTGLTSVTIGNGVTSIGAYAFKGCTGLASVYFNAKQCADFDIGSNVFYDAGKNSEGITVTFGKDMQNIPSYFFYVSEFYDSGIGYQFQPYNAPKVKEIIIENGVQHIGNYAFYGCTGLTSVTIPNSVTSIGESAFSSCDSIEKVHISDVAAWCGIVFENYGSNPLGYANNLYVNDALVTNLTIPNGVSSIGNSAFSGCKGLTSVTIPNSVTSIGEDAFSYCKGLTSVTIPNSVTSIGEDAFFYCMGLTSVTIPDSVTSIGGSAFFGCAGLTSVTIGNGVSSIGNSAFSGCKGLTSVTIPNSVTSIGDGAFSRCTGLTSVTIGNGVSSIGDRAFKDCTGLTSVTIPSSVESIGSLAFSNCSQLKDIFYGGSELAWKLRFSNVSVSGNTTVHFEQPTGQILVSGNCGTDGDNLTWTINDRGNLTVSGKGAMKDYTQSYINYQYVNTSPWGNYAKYLYSAVIENGVTSIGDYAFAFCKNLKSVTIGEDVSNFGSCAFRECSNLEELNYNAKAAADLGTSEYVFDCAGNSGNGICVWVGERVKKIPRDLFCGAAMYFSNHANLRCVFFKGNPPIIDGIGLVSSRSSVYAFYPYGNSEWTASARNSYGSKLIWSAYSDAPATAVSCKTNKTVYLAGETLDVSHLVMTVTREDGCVETIPYASGLLTLEEYDLTTPGAKLIPVTGRGAEGKLSVYVHEQKTETLDKTGYPESSHDYENNLDKTYTYTETDAISLDVTFSEQTEVETNIDYLYVNGTRYTGKDLAGKTIHIDGNKLTVRLVSDKSDSAYGFSIDSIVKTYMGHEYEDTVVPPTCTEQGYTLRSCPCGSEVKQDYVDALGHDMVTDAAVAPTCTKTGLTEGSHCSRCDETIVEQKVVPALGHDMVTDAAVAPTCMKTGLTEGSHCSRCDEATTTQKVVPALGHDMVTDAAVAPTCTKTGLTEGSHCSRCDEATTAQKVVPALGHDMVTDAAVAPTCMKTGLTEGSHCSRCDEATTAQKVVPALGHDTVTDAAVAPTCTKTGLTEGSHCSRCGETIVEQKVVPALGHDTVTDAAVAPTCTKTGLTEGSHCSRCDETIVEQKVVPALGHDTVTDAAVAPTCTKTGLTEGSHCIRCDGTIVEQKVVPALGHDTVTDAAVAPTCTKTGLTEGSHCGRCGEMITEQKVVPALGHDMVTDAAVAPTCTKTGLTEGSHCSRCDDQTTAQEVIPARGHRFNARHICGVCGVEDPVVEITLKKLPTKSSYVVNKEALDVAGGVVLSHYESGETEELNLTAAMVSGFDNTVLGKQTLTVTVGGLTTAFEVEVVERAVTSVAVENGKLVKHYTDGTTEETPLKDGSISDFAISETGEKTLTLSSENACVAAYKDADGNYVALKAVANEDGSYSYVVPEEVTEVTVAVKGDLDGDGLINMKDLARLRHDMADGTGEDGLTNLIIDLDGDGIVNMKDMGLLRRYLAGGYDIELGW